MSIYVFAEVSLAKWTCFKCKKPLSLFPIYITEKGSLCGRCEELQNGGFRCEIFEDIAKNVEFPCCYEQNGCPENLLPGNVANHELHCKFQTITCPFECPNKWIGFLHEFLEHTKKEHPTSVLPDDCCYKVDLYTKKDNELLRHFECIVCMDYMIGPIFLCTKGHSICQSCRDQITKCPMCRSQIQTTRNYTLEGLASDFEFPCKSDKCMFVGKGTVIKKHQETCNFIEKDCPLKELYGCKKKFLYADLSVHIYKEHNKNWYKSAVISYSPFKFDQEYEEVFILKYCSKLFRLNFSYRNELFTFVAKLIDGSEESSNYSFVVDILDTTGNKNRLCYSKNLKAKEQTIQIPFDFIEHLIHLVFNFRMSVLEN